MVQGSRTNPLNNVFGVIQGKNLIFSIAHLATEFSSALQFPTNILVVKLISDLLALGAFQIWPDSWDGFASQCIWNYQVSLLVWVTCRGSLWLAAFCVGVSASFREVAAPQSTPASSGALTCVCCHNLVRQWLCLSAPVQCQAQKGSWCVAGVPICHHSKSKHRKEACDICQGKTQ